MIGYAVANTALGGLAIMLVVRREYGILKRLRSTPLPAPLYLGTVLALEPDRLHAPVDRRPRPRRSGSSTRSCRTGRSRSCSRPARRRAFAGLGLAAAALIRSAEAVAAVVNVILLPMAFLSGSFGAARGLPAGARARRGRAAAEVLDRPRPRRLRARRVDLRSSSRRRRRRRLGALGNLVARRRFGWEPRER